VSERPLQQLGDLFPFGRRQVGTGRVVTAAVQQHDVAGRDAAERVEHALELEPVCRSVVVRVALQCEPGAAEQRFVIRPGRRADVDHRVFSWWP
jgi:hypothetical protein